MAEQPKKDLFDLNALSSESVPGLADPFFPDDPDEILDGEKYVVFEINKENYAIMSDRVAEVVRMLPVTEIPNIPGWFLGIANLRGDILSVIDLSGVMNKDMADSSPKAKLVVLTSEGSDTNLAFRVDRLREIIVLTEEQIDSSSDNRNHLLTGIADYKSLPLNVLDVPEIISSLALR